MNTLPMASPLSPQAPAPEQAPMQLQAQAQAQSQPHSPGSTAPQGTQPQLYQKLFFGPRGDKVSEIDLNYHIGRLRADQTKGPVHPSRAHRLMWMLSQQYPEHAFLGGQYWGPPPDTLPHIVELVKTTPGGVYREQQLLFAHQSGQQNGSRPLWPNESLPPNMMMANPQLGNAHLANPNDSSPNMIPSYIAQGVQQARYGQLSIDPRLANEGCAQAAQAFQQSLGSSFPHQGAHKAGTASQTTQQGPGSSGLQWGQTEPAAARALQRAISHHTYTDLPENLPRPPPSMSYMPSSASHNGHTVTQPSPANVSSQMERISSQASQLGIHRPPSAQNYGGWPNPAASYASVRSPSQPSPYKVPHNFRDQAITPNFRPLPAPLLSQAAGENLAQNVRETSIPQMGSWPPPPVQPILYSKSSQIKIGNPTRKTAKQKFDADAMSMTPEQIQNLSPKKARKMAKWQQQMGTSQQREGPFSMDQQNADDIIDLTGPGPTKKRKTHPTPSSQPSKKANPGLQPPRSYANEPNCGFGPTTHIIRSHTNSPINGPLNRGFVSILSLPRNPFVPAIPIPEHVEAEHFHAYACEYGISLANLELGTDVPKIIRQMEIHAEDVRKAKEKFEDMGAVQSIEVDEMIRRANEEWVNEAIRKGKAKKKMLANVKYRTDGMYLTGIKLSPTWQMRKSDSADEQSTSPTDEAVACE